MKSETARAVSLFAGEAESSCCGVEQNEFEKKRRGEAMSLLHPRGEKLAFNYKRACGLWLIAVSLVIFAAAFIGGKQSINMTVFSLGYIAAFLSINANQSLQRRFSEGPSSPFQRKAGFYAIIV